MNKYEVQLLRNDINELWLIEPTEEFWEDKDGWPDWFKERSHKLGDNNWNPSDEDFDYGFIMYPDTIAQLTEDQKYLYEYDGWKPLLFYGSNRQGLWKLTEDDAIGYFPNNGKLIFGPKEMFEPFFIRVVE